MVTRNLKQIRKIVKSVLVEDEASRNDDKRLYIEVVRKVNPSLLTTSLVDAFNSPSLPNYESVRRNRQWIQARFPELCGDGEVEAWREVHRQTYHDYFRGVTE